jgi:acetylornithine deacetylase
VAIPARLSCRPSLIAAFYGRYYGIPSLSYGASGTGSHGFDESVELASIKKLTLTLANFIAGWCGTRPA